MGKVLTFLGASLCLGLTTAAMAQTAPDAFKDVDKSHWAYEAVESLRSKGIVVGYPDGYFRGKRTLTRYEFAVALDRALKQVVQTPGQKGDVGPQGPPGPAGEAGPQGPPGVTPEELATLRRLAEEFRNELASMGNNINAINARLDKMAADLRAVQDAIAKMPKFSVGAFVGLRSDSGNPAAVDRDGRHTLVPPLAQAVIHSFQLGVNANIAGGATLYGALTFDNYKNYLGAGVGGVATDSLSVVRPLAGSSVPSDARIDTLEITAPFGAIGRGSNLTIGRFRERLGRLTLWKPDVDSYFDVPWVQDGNYHMDGARLNLHFGSVSTEVFGAQTTSVQGTDGIGDINSPFLGASAPWMFGGATSTVGSGKPIAMVNQGQGEATQLMGISAGLGIRQLQGGHIRFTALEAQAGGGGVGGGSPFGNVIVLGSDFDLKVADRVSVTGDYGRTTPVALGHRIKSAPGLDKDNNAFNLNVGYQSGGLGVTAGYRYIDPLFYSPGYWGKIGNWFNPTNVQGPTFRANYDLSGTVGVNVGGDFYSPAHNRDASGGLGVNDEINRVLVGLRWDVAKNFRTTVDWEGVYWTLNGPHGGALPGIAAGANVHPTEHYITIGTGYNLTSSTILKLMYQIGDFNGHGALTDGPNLRQNYNVFATQVAVKF